MSIVWAESFDYYGTGSTGNGGRDYMSAGHWAAFSAGNGTLPFISNIQARTGTYSLRFEYNSLATDSPAARRVLGTAHIVIGIAMGWYFENLPIANKGWGFEFRNNLNQCIAFLAIESDGAIGLYTGSARTLIASSDPIITANSWQHIEAKLNVDDIVGSVEVRVNGVVMLNITDIDIGTLGATQISFGMPAGKVGSSMNAHIDDVVTWNDDGTENNDFLGQQRVETIWAVADTGVTDWVRNTGADDYAAIDDNPQDGDTTYLTGDTGNISEFTLGSLPPETEEIRGVYIPTMGKLIAAGVGNVVTSLVSGGIASDGPDQTFTTAYTYWGSIHELDPDTGLPWTKTGLEAALLRIEKTL